MEDREHATDPEDHGRRSDTLDRALALVRFLRAGCPWDAAQTPDSLIPYLIEESLELSEAILEKDDEKIRHELGDLLLNVAFQIVLGEERGSFTARDVLEDLEDKMRRRHPHLYGEADQPPDWEAHKARERDDDDLFAGLAERLDPLSRAQRIQDRAAGIGFDWDDVRGAFEKLREELDEVEAYLDSDQGDELEAELGDLLFSCVNVARLSGRHGGRALRRANAKFQRRFRRLGDLARQRGLAVEDASLSELDELWEEVKREGTGA